jgi:hypothetical protein
MPAGKRRPNGRGNRYKAIPGALQAAPPAIPTPTIAGPPRLFTEVTDDAACAQVIDTQNSSKPQMPLCQACLPLIPHFAV